MEVLGQNNKKIGTLGLTLVEALVATAIVAIGFISVLQMTTYATKSIDTSAQRTKANYLVEMIAEDLIADKKNQDKGMSPHKHYKTNPFQITDCFGPRDESGAPMTILPDKKKFKWERMLSTERIKCRGPEDKKILKIFEICNDSAKINGTTAICEYKHPDVWEPAFIARMEINMDKGNKRKFIYFQIE